MTLAITRACMAAAMSVSVVALTAHDVCSQPPPPRQLVVVSDENYPPYLFRDTTGRLQGIIKDKWELWSSRTGIPVVVDGMPWIKAQASIQDRSADVIEMLTYTEARSRLYEFSGSSSPVEARVYYHKSVSGIQDTSSMRGFTIGAKEGSACASWLSQRGAQAFRLFPDSEAVVHAAAAGEVRLFCMDAPAAQYFLVKERLTDAFRQTAPLYTAGSHWAVAKGKTALRELIEQGFNRISAEELQEIDGRWVGSPLHSGVDSRYFYYLLAAGGAAAGGALLLAGWNGALRRRVAAGTAELIGQKQVLELIAEGAPLERTLETLARAVEAQSGGMSCSVLLLDEKREHLRHGAAPSLPEAYVRAIDGKPIGERAGSCGTAAYRGTPVIVEDIATDPLWSDYREVAAAHGLRACWSHPVFDAQRRVIGTFALYFREPRRPTPHHRHLIESATHLAAVAIGNKHEHDALRDSESRLRLAVQASSIGLWEWDITQERVYFSPEWKRQLGYGPDEIASRYEEWRDRLHPEDREAMLPRIREYLRNPGPSYEAEYRLRHRDGSYRWIFSRAQVEADANGRPQVMRGCHIDMTERKQAEDELQQSFQRLQELTRRVVEVEEAERRNISRELHDRVGQNLSALNLSLNLVRAQLPSVAPPAIAERLGDAQQLVESSVRQVRDVMADLRPPALDDYGLLAALRTHADALSGRLGVPVVVTGSEPEPRLSPATETALFRIAQEALNNVSKHARAANVEVRLTAVNGLAELRVTDDGIGFDARSTSPQRATWGLTTMRERAEAVGATLRIGPAPAGGTQVVVEIRRES